MVTNISRWCHAYYIKYFHIFSIVINLWREYTFWTRISSADLSSQKCLCLLYTDRAAPEMKTTAWLKTEFFRFLKSDNWNNLLLSSICIQHGNVLPNELNLKSFYLQFPRFVHWASCYSMSARCHLSSFPHFAPRCSAKFSLDLQLFSPGILEKMKKAMHLKYHSIQKKEWSQTYYLMPGQQSPACFSKQ